MDRYDLSNYPARWYCGTAWKDHPEIGWQMIAEGVIIFLLYALFAGLVLVIHRRVGLRKMTTVSAVGFFVLCGGSHLLGDTVIFYWPGYPYLADWNAIQIVSILVCAYQLIFVERNRWLNPLDRAKVDSHYKSIADASTMPFFTIDRDGECVLMSIGFANLVGVDRDSVSADHLRVIGRGSAVLRGGNADRDFDIIYSVDSREIPCRWSSRSILSEAGAVIGTRVEIEPWNLSDLSSFLAHKKFGGNERIGELTAIVHGLPYPYLVVGMAGRVIAVSNAGSEKLGLPENKIVNRPASEFDYLAEHEINADGRTFFVRSL
jgi:PAS domain-containing protein